MKKVTAFFVVLILVFVLQISSSFSATITSRATGNWNSTATWNGGVVPATTDSVVINSGHTVSTNGNRSSSGLLILGTLSIGSGNIVTVDGGIGGTGAFAGNNTNRQIVLTGDWTFNPASTPTLAHTITFNGTSNQLITGKMSTGARLIFNKPNGSSIVLGNAISVSRFTLTAGVLDVGTHLLTAATRTFTTGRIRLAGANWNSNFSGAITQPASGTIEYYALGNQTINNVNYPGNLELTGSGVKTFIGISGATTTVGRNFTVESGVTANVGSGTNVFTISGQTNISGTLNLVGTGNKTFVGAVNINSGGSWSNANNSTVNFRNGITNNGTFSAGTGTHTFSTNIQTISGTLTIPNVTITTITVNNNASLNITTTLGGSGTLAQQINSDLKIGGTATITNLNATANGNSVEYSGTSLQTIKATTYETLIINNSSNANLGGNTTVETNLNFLAGRVILNTFNLRNLGSTTGASGSKYVQTNSTGLYLQTVSNSNVTFHVGNSTYNPVTLSNSGTADVLGVRVLDVVTSPTTNAQNKLITRFWRITEETALGSIINITPQWNSGETTTGYNSGSVVKIGYYNGVSWTNIPTVQSGTDPFSATASFSITSDNITSGVTFGVGKDDAFIANNPVITVGTVTTFGTICNNTISDVKQYSVSASSLSTNLTINAPSQYKVSLNSTSGFTSSLSLAPTSGYIYPTTIFVRYEPTTIGSTSGNVSHTSTGATTRNVAVSGTSSNAAPSVSLPISQNVSSNSAILGGTLTNTGCSQVTEWGIFYSTTNGFANGTGTKVSNVSGPFSIGEFTVNVSGLATNTTYYFKAFVTNSGGTTYSTQATFNTATVTKYTISDGNWNNTAIWSLTPNGAGGAPIPTTGEAVIISGNRNITINTSVNVRSINIEGGSTLNQSGANAVTTNSLIIAGTYNRNSTSGITATTFKVDSGGKYIHAVNGVTLPTITWEANSTCEITGRTNASLTGLNQNFSNLVWACSGQTSTQSIPDAGTMSVSGNLEIKNTGTSSLILNQSALSVNNFIQSGGILNLNITGNSTKTINISGNYSHTAGTITTATTSGTFGEFSFGGNSTQTFISGGILSNRVNYSIKSGAMVDFGNNIISAGSSGNFILNNGGTIITQNTNGLATSGASGTVQLTGTRAYSNLANYIFNGSLAQNTGNGFVGGASLTLNNPSGVTLTTGITLQAGIGLLNIGQTVNTTFSDGGNQITCDGGILNLTSGTLKLGAANATTLPQFATFNINPSTTIEYAASSEQSVESNITYANLTFSGSGQKNVNGEIAITENWTINGGLANLGASIITLDGNLSGSGNISFTNGSLELKGNWLNTGTLTPGTSEVTYDAASGAQIVGAVTYYDLSLTNSSLKNAAGNITVNGNLDLAENPSSERGQLEMTISYANYADVNNTNSTSIYNNLNSYVLTMGPNATTTGAGDVTGKIRRTSIASGVMYTFGNINTQLTFTGISLPTQITVVSTMGTQGLHVDKSNSVKRLYQVLRTGGNTPTTMTIRLAYDDANLNGNTEDNMVLWDHHLPYGGVTPHEHGKTNQDVNNNWVELSSHGVLYLASENDAAFTKYWMISNKISTDTVWIGAVPGGSWNVLSNWNTGVIPSNSSKIVIPDASTTPYDPTITSTVTVGTIEIKANGILNGGSGTLVLTGGPAINGGAGTWLNNGTFNAGTGTVIFDNIDATISGTTTFNNISINTGKKLTIQSGSDLVFNGSVVNNGTFDATSNPNSITYSGTSQNIINPNGGLGGYHNLTISGTNISLPSILDIKSNLIINSVANYSSNTINFNGTSAQSISGSIDPVFNHININNSNGISTLINATVNGTLTFTNGKLNINNNIFTIGGNVVNTVTGGLKSGGAANIVVNNNSNKTLSFDQTTPGVTNKLNSFTNNTSSSTTTIGNMMLITDVIIPTSGTINANGNITLLSNSTKTARIAQGTGNYIIGNIKVQRYIPESARRWRFVSSPVSNATLEDWRGEIFITGPGTGSNIGTTNSNGYDATANNAAGVFWYNETLTSGDLNTGWTIPTNTSHVLAPGRGYRLFVRGDRSDINRITNANPNQNAVTIDVTGPVNKGDITMPVTFTNSGNLSNDGWNLVGNPYPSPFDWKTFHQTGRSGNSGTNYTNIEPTIWVLDPVENTYKFYNTLSSEGTIADGILSESQGFWVKATGPGASITFKESFKAEDAPTQLFKSTPGGAFKIKLLRDALNADDLLVKYMVGSTTNFDAYDVVKLSSPVLVSAWGNDSVHLALSTRPLTTQNDTIKLYVSGSSGTYTMQFTNSDKIALQDQVLLFDTYTNNVVDLKQNNSYSFNINTNTAATFGFNRFYIIVANNNQLPVKLLTFNANKENNNQVKLNWSTAIERNSSRFEIEHATDNKNFKPVGVVNAKGNSNVLTQYTFTHNSTSSINYYRLKQIDLNNTFDYSKVVMVNFNENEEIIIEPVKIYPIPAKNDVTVELNKSQNITAISIYKLDGVLINNIQSNNPKVKLEISDLPQGVYVLQIEDEFGEIFKRKLIKE